VIPIIPVAAVFGNFINVPVIRVEDLHCYVTELDQFDQINQLLFFDIAGINREFAIIIDAFPKIIILEDQ
jgi:hypothetical protein